MKVMMLNEMEWERLSGLPHLAFRIYMVLHWRMDMSTFLVGDVKRISRRALIEWCEVDAVSGRHASKTGQPTEKQVRGALDLLLSEGLLSRPRGLDQFVFLLDLALAGNARPKKDGPRKGRTMGREIDAQSQQQQGNTKDDGPGQSPRMGPHQKERSKPKDVNTAAATLGAVDKSAGMLLPHEIAGWLCQAEQGRGKNLTISITDPLLKSWSVEGVRAETLEAALALAVADRVQRDNPAPVNPGFLNVFVAKLRGQGSSAEPWFRSASGIEGKGRELGLHQSPGEHFPIFKARVFVAAGMSDEEARRWQA